MVKKLFALASVSALGGLVAVTSAAGCTTTEVITEISDSGGDARKDAKVIAPDEDSGPATCPTTDPIDVSQIKVNPPRYIPGSCQASILKDIDTALTNKEFDTFLKFKDFVNAKDPTCGACVFGSIDDTTWAPIVLNSAGEAVVNSAGCITSVSGKEACGKAFQQWDNCLRAACQDCASTSAANTCANATETQTGACSASTAALGSACGTDTVNDYLQTCGDIGTYRWDASIQKLCIDKSSDAGTDSGDAADAADAADD